MNKKLILMFLSAALISTASVYSSENKDLEVTKAQKTAKCFKKLGNCSLLLPATLLGVFDKFKDMSFAKKATVSTVVWLAIAIATKVLYDKYQERKKRTQDDEGLKKVLAVFDAQLP